MRLSYISALLLAPIALATPLASPIASPDSISITQRDASSPIEARNKPVSVRIMTIVEESEKITDLCKKFSGKLSESFAVYKQFKKCHKAVEHADHDAKHSGPFGESESMKVEESMGKLTVVFVKITKSVLYRKEMIRNSRYKNTMLSELEKIRVFVKSFHKTCEEKSTPSHKQKIKLYGEEVDAQFVAMKNGILDTHSYKAQRSLESGPEEEKSETKERFSFPGFSSFAEFPGSSDAEKKSLESRSDKGNSEEIEERSDVPWTKRTMDFFKHMPEGCNLCPGQTGKGGGNEGGMFSQGHSMYSHEQSMQMFKDLMHMVSSQPCKASGCKDDCPPEETNVCRNKNSIQSFLQSFMDRARHAHHGKRSIRMYQSEKE